MKDEFLELRGLQGPGFIPGQVCLHKHIPLLEGRLEKWTSTIFHFRNIM